MLHTLPHNGAEVSGMPVIKRANTFHLRRRVPKRYGRVEPRETVWISLSTDSESVAKSKADRA